MDKNEESGGKDGQKWKKVEASSCFPGLSQAWLLEKGVQGGDTMLGQQRGLG